jgi:phenylalanyl-tRNA synthetase beta chain
MSLSIRFVLQSNEKTLEEDDITNVMDSILKVLDDNLSIGLR